MFTKRSENVTAILQQIAQGRVSAEQGNLLLHSLVADAEISARNKMLHLRMMGRHA